jgi:hypothetical protein
MAAFAGLPELFTEFWSPPWAGYREQLTFNGSRQPCRVLVLRGHPENRRML